MSAIQPSPKQADTSFRAAVRLLASLMPDAAIATGAEPPLESLAQATEPPRTVGAIILEDAAMRVHRVFEPPVAQFAAFLDGTQASRTLYSCDDGTPIVHGTAAAVIRERRNKRLYTRRHLVEHRLSEVSGMSRQIQPRFTGLGRNVRPMHRLQVTSGTRSG